MITREELEKEIAKKRSMLMRMPQHSDRWYSMLADIAALTREWKKSL